LDWVKAVKLESQDTAAPLQVGGGHGGFIESVNANQDRGAFFAMIKLHLQDLITEWLEDFFGNLFYV
jgi:hypothetical protein